MYKRGNISSSDLHRIISYDPSTGAFVWKRKNGTDFWTNSWNNRCAGKVAGTTHSSGYLIISVNNSLFKAHRLAWLYSTGEWPVGEIDHINGDRSDNRLCNLRLAAHKDNGKNRSIHKNNRSGFKGVSFHKQMAKWRADVTIDGKRHYLGLFDTIEGANVAYCSAAIELYGEFARTS